MLFSVVIECLPLVHLPEGSTRNVHSWDQSSFAVQEQTPKFMESDHRMATGSQQQSCVGRAHRRAPISWWPRW